MNIINYTKNIIQQNPLKTGLLVFWTSAVLLWILWYKKSESQYKPRNKIQAEVIEQDTWNHYTEYYDKKIANIVPYYAWVSYINKYQDNIITPSTVPSEIQTICKLPEIWWKSLPLPITMTWEAFAGTLSKNIQQGGRDISIPDYTSLLPRSAVSAIWSSAICITSARSFINYHLGNPSNLTDLAYDFFARKSEIRYNPETKKSDWSVRYTTHFLKHNDIGYTAQDFKQLQHIQSGDMIFILYAGSNYKAHRFRDENPATHIMIGVGQHTISIPTTMMKWVDIWNDNEIIRAFINCRIDKSHKKLSKEEFIKNKQHVLQRFPNLSFPHITRRKNIIEITWDWTVDGYGKMCFRLIRERLLQSSFKEWQNWFVFNPTAIYSLTNPSKFFKDTDIYYQSLEFSKGVHTSWFILPDRDGQWSSVSEKIWKFDSTSYENTLQTHRFLQTIHQGDIPLPIITSIDSSAHTMIIEKIKSDFPLQQAQRTNNIAKYNSTSSDRTIIDIQQWDNRWWKIISHLNHYIATHDSILNQERQKLTINEKINALSSLSWCTWVFHSDNTVRKISFWDTLQTGEQIIFYGWGLLEHIEKNIILHNLISRPSLPIQYYVIDHHLQDIIQDICLDRPDIAHILMGIATAETPWWSGEYAYKRKQVKYGLEHYLWWYGISSQGAYQMRAINYDINRYKQTISYLKSEEFQYNIQEKLHLIKSWEREDYRNQYGGSIVDQIDHILQQNPNFTLKKTDPEYDNHQAAKFINLFEKLVEMKFTYSDKDIIQLSFATSLAKYDLIQRKRKFINNISTITNDNLSSSNDNMVQHSINILSNPNNRRSIDELVRLMHHTGEKAIYQKLIILYLDQILKERKLNENPDKTIRTLPDYENQPFTERYPLYLDAIYKRLNDLSTHEHKYGNSMYYTAKDFLTQLDDINLYSNKINDMKNIQKLIEIIKVRSINTGVQLQTHFIPSPEVLYTNPLFKDYIARADIDKSAQNDSIWLFMSWSWLLLLFLLITSIEWYRNKNR